MKRTILAFLLATAALTGCHRDSHIATPDGFAELHDQERYDYRATNAEGVVLAVIRKDNEPRADLHFWAGALDAQLQRSGYDPQKAVDIKSADGIPGKQLRYTIERNRREHSYWITVFVTDSDVVTVEAGGDQVFFEDKHKPIQQAIRSLDVG